MTSKFFKELSRYYDNENDLSNVTCAMCNSSMIFREKFIHFFFPDVDITAIRSIEREVCDEKNMHSRVDFLIRMDGDSKPYLIEVKIYDQNHHFGQYEAAYDIPKERLGYITNYYCFEGIDKGYDVKTWDKWVKTLEQDAESICNPEDRFLFQGYIEYVNSVCGFSNIISSLDFNADNDEEFKAIVKHALVNGGMPCKPVTTIKESLKHNVITFYYNRDEKTVLSGFCGYIGINGKPVICIGFCKTLQKSRSIYDALLSKGMPKSEWTDEMVKMRYFSSPTILIPMSEDKHEQFIHSSNGSEQSKIIADFVDCCLRNIMSIL